MCVFIDTVYVFKHLLVLNQCCWEKTAFSNLSNVSEKKKKFLAATESIHLHIPVESKLWPGGLAGRRCIQELQRGAVDVQDETVVQLKF